MEVKAHPRNGFVVEVWLGKTGEHLILVEIHECYNIWGQPESLGYHYRAYDLLTHYDLGVKTIGSLGLDTMRDFAREHAVPYKWHTDDPVEWKQLR